MQQLSQGVLSALLVVAVLAGCPGHTRMPPREQEGIQETLRHRSRQLAVSMYFGPFFRDGRYYLLSHQPPGDLDLLRSPKGERMHPGDALGVLPAGTEARIANVEFATATAATTRSLLTPRFFTWVLVEIEDLDRPAVLVIRDEPDSHDEFLEILTRYLSTEDVSSKVASYPEEVQAAIREKRLTAGMDLAAVRMAWGHPLQVTRDFDEGVRVDRWSFEGPRHLVLRDERLVSWSASAEPD